MTNQIHGHEVMQMMIESGKTYTHDSLREAIIHAFGPAARFFTCSANGMTADELIQFLDSRGKFLHEEGEFKTQPDKICDH